MQIHVKTLTGKTITLDMDNNSTIKELKTQIESKKGIPPTSQRLVFKGKRVENEHTLAAYNITEGATLHLALRLRGGAMT